MVAIFQTTFWIVSLEWKLSYFIKIPLKHVHQGLSDNAYSMVKVMTWRRIGDKSLLEPMMTQFADA